MKKNNKVFVFLMIMIVACVYIGRVYYINVNANDLRKVNYLEIGKWENCYGGSLKIEDLSIVEVSKLKEKKLNIDDNIKKVFVAKIMFKNINTDVIEPFIKYDDYLFDCEMHREKLDENNSIYYFNYTDVINNDKDPEFWITALKINELENYAVKMDKQKMLKE